MVSLEMEMEVSDGEETRGMEKEDHEQLPGFIFMCNGKTKLDCFRYRVFGLPEGRKDVVERIKPGMKLFLYDFEKKVLYGIYEAILGGGRLNIEPDAFQKKYPAQVGFRIFKNCYPLLENTLKSVIHENYTGTKFKQHLSPQQVASLLSLFRSFSAPELDSAANRLASRMPSFEERFIASRKLRLTSSALDSPSVRHEEPRLYSNMAHLSVSYNTSPVQHSYSNYTNPSRKPLNLPSLNEQYTRPLLGDSTRSSIQDPHLKYLTILSNIRRYGANPEGTVSETDNYPSTSSGNEQYAYTYSTNGYYPSQLSGNELPSASAASHNVSYPSNRSGNEFYTLTSQREGEANQPSQIPAPVYYYQQVSMASNATIPAQSDVQAVHVPQSHSEATGYPPMAHGQEVEATGYAPQQQTVALGYTTHPHQGSVEDNGQSYAGAMAYSQQQHVIGYTPQPYEYVPQMHVEAVGYTQQSAVDCTSTQTYYGTAEGTYVNQSYYPYTADTTTNPSYYNQTH